MCSKPKISEVHAILKDLEDTNKPEIKNGLIVHFSGDKQSRSHEQGKSAINQEDFKTKQEKLFPNDLLNVIVGGAMGGVSCSVVWPGDKFDSQCSPWNAVGSIGVILAPKCKRSLKAVDSHDCGSYIDLSTGKRIFKDEEITSEKLKESLRNRGFDKDGRKGSGEYNEWVLEDFKVIGIFAAKPFHVFKPIESSELEAMGLPVNLICSGQDPRDHGNKWAPLSTDEAVCFAELARIFPNPDLPIYTFDDSRILLVDKKDGTKTEVAHADIYRHGDPA